MGNELGYGCFNDDPDFAQDYTSTGEYITYRYYAKIAHELQSDPYFKKQSCFAKVLDHAKEKGIVAATVSQAYWSSRLRDLSFQSPAISDVLNQNYFLNGSFLPKLEANNIVSCSVAQLSLEQILSQYNEMEKLNRSLALSFFWQALNNYNGAVSLLRSAIATNKPLDIAKKQAAVQKRAIDFIKAERETINQLLANDSGYTKNCERPL